MKLLYFAWLKSKIGVAEEERAKPEGIDTAGALIDWLCAQEDRYATAFAHRDVIKIAINQDFADSAAPITDRDEIAFFPPVTGG